MDDYRLNAKINGLIEYINIIITSIYDFEKTNNNYDELNESITLLREIKKEVEIINNEKDIDILKEKITEIDEQIKDYFKNHERELTGREKALVERGYDKETVLRLSSFENDEIQAAAAIIFQKATIDCKKVSKPICIYLGGQPGCGKSTLSRKIKNSDIENGILEIGLDNYRTYHPHYIEIEEAIKNHWKNRQVTNNDSPGNDIADFTHNFAGLMTDILTDMAIEKENGKSYNIVFEWGMREPTGPLSTMKKLKENGYSNIVNFIAVDKKTSLEACDLRANIMNNQNHIIRRVPDYFHELCIKTLPDSVNTIYQNGFVKDKTIDLFNLTDRTGKIIWSPDNELLPGKIYDAYLNNPNLSVGFENTADLAEQSYTEETQGLLDSNQKIKDETQEKNIITK